MEILAAVASMLCLEFTVLSRIDAGEIGVPADLAAETPRSLVGTPPRTRSRICFFGFRGGWYPRGRHPAGLGL